MRKQFITPKGTHAAATYSYAVRAGNTIYLAGHVGRDANGKVVEGGIAAQTEQAFQNLRRTLEAADATLGDLVKLTIHLTDIEMMTVVREVRARYLTPPMPASTAVEVVRLAPDVLIEIDGTAVVDDTD
ncbi:Putative translation initiation inhibitor, yjgF family [Paraburkholderia caribensis MBA4]|uniref:Translation initiation inhibitor, yjgF family n=1 Tax=Paraburkholderia caribensis MBA4 TaxID=1323664 RepID=A0A0P0RIT4_9BURK|nr:RidA family protein [Paraburkholderia caribensis]ALL68424.1 Putative translation initiation inhibitor, yjgF family [Paraburkholderia caribensis MBA4]